MKPCIQTTLLAVFLSIMLADCGQQKPGFDEDLFLGEWYAIKGDVEVYSFLKDEDSYIFVGTIGMRPVVYGTWKIDRDKFIITMDNGTTTEYSFALSNDTLVFNESSEIYTRTTPLEVKYPEVLILLNITSAFSHLNFSSPQPEDLKWGYWIDSAQTVKEFFLNGYSMSAKGALSGGDIKEISNYLKDYGLESDTNFVTDICDGYLDNNLIVTVCANQDADASDDSIYIQVTSALIIK